jgi:hypothetical protein
MKRLAIALMFPTAIAAQGNQCEYDHRITGNYVKKIDKVENIQKLVTPYLDDTRKCSITLDAWVDGTKHNTSGHFTFTPDMSENDGCRHAEQRAKENLIRKVSPEILSADTKMKCGNGTQQAQQNSSPYPSGTIIPLNPQNRHLVQGVPVIYYSSSPPPPPPSNNTLDAVDILKFGLTLLPFVGRN